jgi:ribonuclease BN (tRNA processing enzyme)
MKINVLGCGDASASGGRLQTAFYVEADNVKFMIDCGATALVGIKKMNIDHRELDAIFLTHLHGDHFGGIPYLLIDLNITKRTKPLHIFGPKESDRKIKELAEVLYKGHGVDKNKFQVLINDYVSGETFSFKSIKVTTYKVKHTDSVYPHALRFELEGKVICFSGDTQWVNELIPAAKDSDLFISECSFYDTKFEGHMSYTDLEQHLPEINSKKVLLSHMSLEVLSKELPVTKAEDGMIIEI